MAPTTDEVMQHEFVNVNGIRMHYVTMGNGPLIVFLHGFPEFWYSWRHQIPFFSKQFKVVVPDMRGYGETERPTEIDEYRIEKLVTDIVDLIHSLGQEKATIVGHDWGGATTTSRRIAEVEFTKLSNIAWDRYFGSTAANFDNTLLYVSILHNR